ncbi:pre-rRNA processing protein Utp22 [Didymella exigua CBS 183.55]|uniref:U3 small nucleolar RNA-associated protein 22 n=1 Tax=Didymella exigua CBS 183.55 TaxID=1150837 RepID=A0A6A5RCT1_9PLEO|nr:pre-rRNA processing protein Utp22 [Didymella exigua CBS 183.55]KAF1923557.1 pre-rRNA processing protein Utp22 [Didymella exigua CBS 183.55]
MPPATKRRKLEQSEDESEGSFADFGALDSAGSEVEEEANGEDSPVSMEGPAAAKHVSDDDEAEESAAQKHEKSAPVHKHKKRPAATLQDGAYASESFKSNLFKLQVDELLEQVKPKYGKKEAPAENVMRTLKTIIESLPSREALPIPEAEKALKSAGIAVPFPSPRPPKDAMYKLAFERPSSINATGSYPLKTATKSDDGIAIDLVVTMPKALFQDKDYLNHRYFYKRAYYLACLAAGIARAKKHKFALSFENWHGNQLQPILVVRPSGNGDADDFSSSKARINIIPALPENTLAPNKLLPNANAVRPKDADDEAAGKVLPPTPFYNSAVQSDANITAYLKLLYATATTADAFKDACVLGRIWLKQRGFGSQLRKGGFGNFEWAALVALLLQPNQATGAQPLSPGYSSYQLFKAALQFIARHDLSKKAVVLHAHNITIPKGDTTPVFFDGPRGQNILFRMTQWSYACLRQEAQATVDMLSDTVFDQFDATFILKTEVLKFKYDATLEIPLSAFGLDPASEAYNQQLSSACHKLYATLSHALTDRVTSISFTMPVEEHWSITTKRPQEKQRKCILVNFATDPANANRTVDHGPAAENKQEAAVFRKFWGEKSELRRFKDGSITESIVWSAKDVSVIEQIVRYILPHHKIMQGAEQLSFTGDAFAHLISAGRIQGASGVAPFLPIMNAFAAMEKDLRALEDLPLQLRSIRAADAQLRYASIEPPAPGHTPASVVLQFEGSGRWPDDLCAIQRTKIAFLLRIADLVAESESEYTARVGLENPSQPAQNQAFLDLTSAAGFTFRIRIHHDREQPLLERQLQDKALDAGSRESAAASLALHKRDFTHAPRHTQVVQTLATRFPALSPALRLTKRWFAAHLLAPHFAPELLELLVLRTFLQPHPWTAPACATTGFLRTLAWLARWDWRHTPLIVDLSSAAAVDQDGHAQPRMQAADLARLTTRFEAWRRIDAGMNRVVLFAATTLDGDDGTTWTDKCAPATVVAARLTALASAATTALRRADDALLRRVNGQDAGTALDPESLFAPSTTEYDITLTLASRYTPSGAGKAKRAASAPSFKNLALQRGESYTPAAPCLPSLFAHDLRAVYGDAVLWFWDPEILDRICGLWNPLSTRQRSWKVKPGWNSAPVRVQAAEGEEGVQIGVNREAVVHEIRRLGGELVRSVEVRE